MIKKKRVYKTAFTKAQLTEALLKSNTTLEAAALLGCKQRTVNHWMKKWDIILINPIAKKIRSEIKPKIKSNSWDQAYQIIDRITKNLNKAIK